MPLPSRPFLAGLLDRPLHALDGHRILVADVDVAHVGVRREAADDHPFDEQLRVALHEIAVHERARVALVGVADEVLGLALGVEEELPLEAGREGRAAASPEAGVLHLLDHVHRLHLQRPRQAFVAAASDVVLDAVGVGDAAVRHQPPHLPAPELERIERAECRLPAGFRSRRAPCLARCHRPRAIGRRALPPCRPLPSGTAPIDRPGG